MKKIALATVFALAALPLTFAAQSTATPSAPAGQSSTSTTTKKPVKKHAKKTTKKSETTKSASTK